MPRAPRSTSRCRRTPATPSYLRAVRDVVAPAVRRFRPDVIVTMTGVNPHHTDPMAHLQVTTWHFRR